MEKIATVDKYLVDGCMRCKYGGTPQCKVLNWVDELKLLREIVLPLGLKEDIKWGVPVYTFRGKNIITINALKGSVNIGFFKGVLLTDTHKLLQQQGSLQSDRIIKFTSRTAIEAVKDILSDYIVEAMAIEEKGLKFDFEKDVEPVPDELLEAFAHDAAFKSAFYALSPGKQRAYLIHFSKAKQSQTRIRRIAQYKEQILKGIGLNDYLKS